MLPSVYCLVWLVIGAAVATCFGIRAMRNGRQPEVGDFGFLLITVGSGAVGLWLLMSTCFALWHDEVTNHITTSHLFFLALTSLALALGAFFKAWKVGQGFSMRRRSDDP